MVWRMSGGRDNEYVALLGERHALPKWANGAILEVNEVRLPPPWPTMGQVTLHFSSRSAGSLPFFSGNPGLAARQMKQSSSMIGMEMRQHNLAHISGSESEIPELRADLFVRIDRKTDRAPVERMPGRMVSVLMDTRGFPGIDHDDSLIMLDGPGINRQPF